MPGLPAGALTISADASADATVERFEHGAHARLRHHVSADNLLVWMHDPARRSGGRPSKARFGASDPPPLAATCCPSCTVLTVTVTVFVLQLPERATSVVLMPSIACWMSAFDLDFCRRVGQFFDLRLDLFLACRRCLRALSSVFASPCFMRARAVSICDRVIADRLLTARFLFAVFHRVDSFLLRLKNLLVRVEQFLGGFVAPGIDCDALRFRPCGRPRRFPARPCPPGFFAARSFGRPG